MSVVLADDIPPAPTPAVTQSSEACAAYATTVSKYFSSLSQPTFMDILNGCWFDSFAFLYVPSFGSHQCVNNVCTNYYWMDGQTAAARGCMIVGSDNPKAKQIVFNQLTTAYQVAMQHQTILKPVSYGFYGSDKVCSAQDNFKGCDVFVYVQK